MAEGEGNVFVGMLLCWLLNLAHLGIVVLVLFLGGDRTLPGFFILLGAFGLFQFVYLAPVYRLLKRRSKISTAKGIVIAASFTALLNASWWVFWGLRR